MQPLDQLPVPLFLDLCQLEFHELPLDLISHDDILLELVRLHGFHGGVVSHLWHEVFVHVEQDVFDNVNDLLLQVPDVRDLFQQVLIWHVDEPLGDGLEHLCRSLLHVIVEHLSMLV